MGVAATTHGWRDTALLELVTIKSGQVDPRVSPYRELPLIAPDHLASGTGRLTKKVSASAQGAISGKYLVQPGDVIYSKIRPYLQKAYKCDFEALCSADMYPLTPRRGVDSSFILHSLLGHDFTTFAVSVSARSGIPKINREELAEYRMSVPGWAEQRTIARALDDADNLIGALERLIAKKQALKHGMMQALLTGRTRLPGLTDEWTHCHLGDVLTVRHGRSQRAVERPSGVVPILATGGQIGWADRPLYSKPSVLIGRKGTIDRPQYQSKPFWTVDTLFYTEIAPNTDPKYLFYVFQTVDWRSMNEASGVPSLSSTRVENVEVHLPDLPEQIAIREVLDDAEAELSSLNRRLIKARAIKQSMMQQLLTGRVRFPVEAAA